MIYSEFRAFSEAIGHPVIRHFTVFFFLPIAPCSLDMLERARFTRKNGSCTPWLRSTFLMLSNPSVLSSSTISFAVIKGSPELNAR